MEQIKINKNKVFDELEEEYNQALINKKLTTPKKLVNENFVVEEPDTLDTNKLIIPDETKDEISESEEIPETGETKDEISESEET